MFDITATGAGECLVVASDIRVRPLRRKNVMVKIRLQGTTNDITINDKIVRTGMSMTHPYKKVEYKNTNELCFYRPGRFEGHDHKEKYSNPSVDIEQLYLLFEEYRKLDL